MRELDPVIFYRIYRTDNSIWNFNPNYCIKNSNLLGEKFLKDGHIWYLYTLILDKMKVSHIKLPNSPGSHLTGFVDGLRRNNMLYCCGNNLTSNPHYDSIITYSGTTARNNPQIQTSSELWRSDHMETYTDKISSGFQIVVKELHLSQ